MSPSLSAHLGRILPIVLSLGALVSASAQDTLSFNFVGSGGTLGSAETAGTSDHTADNWNNLTTATDGSASNDGAYANGPSPLTTASGETLTARLWWRASGVFTTGVGTSTGDQKLMSGYLDSGGAPNSGDDLFANAANQPYFAIADIPASFQTSGYDVIIYTDGANAAEDQVREFWLTTISARIPPMCLRRPTSRLVSSSATPPPPTSAAVTPRCPSLRPPTTVTPPQRATTWSSKA
jgi:hypothetical protein